jgi:hypothetical protein
LVSDEALLYGEFDCNCPESQSDPQRWNKLAAAYAKLQDAWTSHLAEQPSVQCWLCGSCYYASSSTLKKVSVDDDDSPAEQAFRYWQRPSSSRLRRPRTVTNCTDAGVIRALMCSSCATLYRRNRVASQIDLRHDFGGAVPAVLSALMKDEPTMLSTVRIKCSSHFPRCASAMKFRFYRVGFNVQPTSPTTFAGQLGLTFISASSAEVGLQHRGSKSRQRLAAAVTWLRRYNPLVKELLCQAETLHGHFSRCVPFGHFARFLYSEELSLGSNKEVAISSADVDVELAPVHQNRLQRRVGRATEGHFVFDEPAFHQAAGVSLGPVALGSATRRSNSGSVKALGCSVPYGEHSMEARVFTTLFPYGSGGWCHRSP